MRGKTQKILDEFVTAKKNKNPPHWYFPISYEEMKKKRRKNFEKALKKIGVTREELNKKYEHLEKRKNKRKRRRKT